MNQLHFYQTHLPRCLAGFAAKLATLDDWQFDGHASPAKFQENVTIQGPDHVNTVFQLSCKCGSDRHRVWVHPWTNPDRPDETVILSPLALQCADCQKLTELIDTEVHGYDGEMGASATMRGQGNRDEVECGGCDLKKIFQVYVRFEYPDDLLSGDFKEFDDRQQDLFTWFSLVGKCIACSSLLPVADFECA